MFYNAVSFSGDKESISFIMSSLAEDCSLGCSGNLSPSATN
jgi:hypothetical protein